MQKNSLGDTLRELRKQKRLSQEDLAEGICSPVSISRIENGNQIPSQPVLEALLEKLGTGLYQICNVYYRSEQQQAFEEKAQAIINLGDEENIDQAWKELEHLQQNCPDDTRSRQLCWLVEATLRLQCHDTAPESYPLQETMDLAQKALALTRPNFDYENFPNSVLTIFEVDLLHIIVAIWAGMDRNMDALRLGERLYASLKKHESDVVSYQRAKINVVRNLGAILAKMKMYQDALQYIDEAEALSLKNDEHSLLVMIELTRAKIYYLTGRKEECADILKTLAAYTALTKQKTDLSSIQRFAHDKLGLDL
ncbi:helix-turn-helix transcriptional regulator [Pseudoflavonifractor capillosus]|uniref:helix-turn-helix domain-containing protein n=1 Tax=Pseudoflavonifractor capillosus TaxID=106588 RepID=UPI00195E7C48|nr:helix-turn-helix transcriptional regulator [Pseudoflavonifractor capillosus]MBM6694103.1 helix-turn-helix transcriptional regulator [Pseudoflavonifractor capillosus]